MISVLCFRCLSFKKGQRSYNVCCCWCVLGRGQSGYNKPAARSDACWNHCPAAGADAVQNGIWPLCHFCGKFCQWNCAFDAPWFCSFRLWRFINHLLTYFLIISSSSTAVSRSTRMFMLRHGYGAIVSRSVSVYSPAIAGTHCAYPRKDGQAELIRVAGYVLRWFTRQQMVTHPSTNRVRCRVTSLIETNALPPSQTTTKVQWETKMKGRTG